MKTLTLTLNFEALPLNKEDKEKSSAEVVTNVIKNVMLVSAQESKGFSEEERRLYYKVCDILEKAVKDKMESVDIDDNYYEFIKKAFKHTRLMPNDLLRQIENLLK